MNAHTRLLLAATVVAATVPPSLAAQTLHVDHRWKDCSIVIDPSLTQDAWHQFVAEVGHVLYFRPLASAKPLGARRFEAAVMQWATQIDDTDAAWNDTFVHPHEDHWLFDGNALPIPGLMLRAGVTDRVDVGAYVTKNPNANYGFFGGQVQYNLLNDLERHFAAAGRVSYMRLFGPEDLNASVLGLDVLASRDFSAISPYVGVSGYLSRGQERTAKVDLENENVFGVQGTMGVAVNLRALRLGAEYSVGRVNGYSVKIAFGS